MDDKPLVCGVRNPLPIMPEKPLAVTTVEWQPAETAPKPEMKTWLMSRTFIAYAPAYSDRCFPCRQSDRGKFYDVEDTNRHNEYTLVENTEDLIWTDMPMPVFSDTI